MADLSIRRKADTFVIYTENERARKVFERAVLGTFKGIYVTIKKEHLGLFLGRMKELGLTYQGVKDNEI